MSKSSKPKSEKKTGNTSIRDRIKDFRRVKSSELLRNPRNWRTHPPEQQAALRGMLAEVGIVDALIARELENGDLELIDGHLRSDAEPDAEWPVLVLDVTEQESLKVLATLDPLSAMAGVDVEKLSELLGEVETDSESLGKLLSALSPAVVGTQESTASDESDRIATRFAVIIECESEQEQLETIDHLVEEGYECRALSV